MDRVAWWAAVRRVAQSRTRLKQLSIHICIGEGKGNPLQYSCLENPMDRGAWWAAIYGVSRVGHDQRDLAAAAEGIMVTEISQTEKDKNYISHVNLKYTTKKKQTHRYREQSSGYQ